MGKRKIKSEDEFKIKMLPVANDIIGLAKKNAGF